MFSAEPLQN